MWLASDCEAAIGQLCAGIAQRRAEGAASHATTMLPSLIKYCGSAIEDTVEAFAQALKQDAATKEDYPLFAAIASSGAGKTELCHQLVLRAPPLLNESCGTKACVIVHVSFNQNTTWALQERDILKAMWWRVVLALTGDRPKPGLLGFNPQSWPASFEDMESAIREAAAAANSCSPKETAVVFLLDEITKVPQQQRCHMLDDLTSLQQARLMENTPLFVLATSLDLHHDLSEWQTRSKRKIEPIPLHVPDSTLLEKIANMAVEKALDWRGLAPGRRKELLGRGDLHRVMQYNVHVIGHHYRSLELVLKLFFEGVLTPACLANIADEKIKTSLHPTATNEDPLRNPFALRLADEVCVTAASQDDKKKASCRFLTNLLLSRVEQFVSENSVAKLLNIGIAFVRERDGHRLDRVRPYFQLPLLFEFWKERARELLGPCFDDPERAFSRTAARAMSAVLGQLGSMLQPQEMKDRSRSFEQIIPRLMFVRLCVKHNLHMDETTDASSISASLEKLLPGAKLVPWSGAPNVTTSSVSVTLGRPDDKFVRFARGIDVASPDDKFAPVRALHDEFSPTTFLREQGKIDTEAIESAGPMTTDGSLLLWSMKLRQHNSDSVAKVANRVHEIAAATDIQKGRYWAVVVNCQPADKVDEASIPEGTIYLPADCTKALLSPFGASYLLVDVCLKAGINVAE
eukprot:m.8910 g.8910  ORF g.8910 m.8910 type:complete len:688 (-) comp2910_c0_seq1:34-2097(-)